MPKLLLATLLPVLCAAQERPAIDWPKLHEEAIRHFQALIRIDTSNPPGNETKAAEYIRRVLEGEGIAVKLLAREPDRANLVARIKGNGKKRPLLIMGHTDVVGVQREKWTFDPFGGERKNGYIYGRGALDDKDNLTACLMNMLMLARLKTPLDRDVIFLAEASEEGGGPVGIDFVVANHWNEIEAEFALAEGGGGLAVGNTVKYLTVATTEKVPRGARLVATGTAGHGSAPRLDNAVVRLANAVARVGAWQPPMRLNDTTRTYFERLATISKPEDAARYNNVVNPEKTQEVQRYFAEHELGHWSMLRTSISPTILRAGFRTNVIPSDAEATLDIRALPGENLDAFYDLLGGVINDPNVKIVPNRSYRPSAAPSRLDTEMFRLLERVQKDVYPGAVTLPTMLTGATDMAQLRAKGVQSYGIGPLMDEKDRSSGGGAHGDDEKIMESHFLKFVEYQWRVVLEMAGAR
ncbi:MAG: M20/M25/M40 family metallo-hydrolase [Acidobacteria bacterium]|nr:M20/M25/M40 family metallo-hydrolase [Acidobacteriota bacterium]